MVSEVFLAGLAGTLGALGGSAITAAFSYCINAQNVKANAQRLIEESRARLDQQEAEYVNQLQKEVIERRTEFRRQRLMPLLDALEKLLALSARYRHIAGSLYEDQLGVDNVELPPTAIQTLRETTREVWTIRTEVFGSYTWLGIGNARLAENIHKLNRSLSSLEVEAREYADMLNARESTRQAAKEASKGLDDLLTETALLVEQLISGSDLVPERLNSNEATGSNSHTANQEPSC